MTIAPSLEAYSPKEVAERVARLGVAKANNDAVTLFILAVLAGAFIAVGALLFTVVVTGSTLGLGPTRLLGGAAFSLGLILVVVAGAELFTGDNLVAMAWAQRLVPLSRVLRLWAIVYAGNLVGALLTVAFCWVGGAHTLGNGEVGKTLLAVAHHKAELDPLAMLALGIMCNALVCLAVWLTQAGHTVVDKVVAVVFPISAFVAVGFEHSIANMFFLPYGMLLASDASILPGALANIALVTVGNVIGGTVLVAGIYWLAYLRRPAAPPAAPAAS